MGKGFFKFIVRITLLDPRYLMSMTFIIDDRAHADTQPSTFEDLDKTVLDWFSQLRVRGGADSSPIIANRVYKESLKRFQVFNLPEQIYNADETGRGLPMNNNRNWCSAPRCYK